MNQRWSVSCCLLVFVWAASAAANSSPALAVSPDISLVANAMTAYPEASDYGPPAPPEKFLPVANQRFVFTEGGDASELWVTDSTPGGTRQLTDLCLGPCVYRHTLLGSNGSRALSHVFSITLPSARGLWVSDGTMSGTTQLRNLTGEAASFHYLGALPTQPATMYLAICEQGCALWRTDGTVAGTQRVAGLTTNSGNRVGQAAVVAGKLYFTLNSPARRCGCRRAPR